MSEPSNGNPQSGQLALITRQILRQGHEAIVLQTVCAALLVEVCRQASDPKSSFKRLAGFISATIAQTAESAARSEGTGSSNSRVLTQTTENILTSAETLLARDFELPAPWRKRTITRST